MNCPRCQAALKEINRSGVMIDICPECKGIWLDRGELEKIMQIEDQYNSQFVQPLQPPSRQPAIPQQPQQPFDPYGQPQYGYGHQGYPHKKKRKSLLGEIFDEIFD